MYNWFNTFAAVTFTFISKKAKLAKVVLDRNIIAVTTYATCINTLALQFL